MNEGIMSGMTPVRLKDGGFPDLTGDGKVTQKDILKGRGVQGFADGGDADKSFYNLRRTAPGSGLNARDLTDLVFDPTDPVDYAIAGLMIFPPAGIAAKLIKMGVKGNKLRKKMKKVEAIKNAQRSMGTKAKDLFTTNPIDNMAAANGLVLGPTKSSIKGKAAQLATRNFAADMAVPHNKKIEKLLGKKNLYSKEMFDYINESPENREEVTREGGIVPFAKDVGGVISEVAPMLANKEDRGFLKDAIVEEIQDIEFDPSRYIPPFLMKKPVKKADGGIIGFKRGGKVVLTKAQKILAEAKAKAAKAKAAKADKPKSSATKINEKLKPKTQTPAQKKAAAERKRQAANKKAAKQRQADIDAKAKANADARRKADTDEFNQRQNPVGPPKPGNAGKSSAGKDSKIPEGKVDDLTLGQKTFNVLNPNVFNPATKYKVPKVIGGLYAAKRVMDEEDDYKVSDQKPVDSLVGNNLSLDDIFNQDIQGNIPDTNPDEWAQIMKDRIVNDRGIPLDDQGNFTQKPKFMDYLKSLPGAYSDKVQRDPDFAKKMMAGFLNMMKPVEGYVPINSAVAFGEGYLGEETRQSDMLSAEAKTLQFLQDNPDLKASYIEGKLAESGTLLSDAKQEEANKVFFELLGNLANKFKVPLDNIGDYKVIYRDPTNGKTVEIDSTVLLSMGDQSVQILASPNLELVLR